MTRCIYFEVVVCRLNRRSTRSSMTGVKLNNVASTSGMPPRHPPSNATFFHTCDTFCRSSILIKHRKLSTRNFDDLMRFRPFFAHISLCSAFVFVFVFVTGTLHASRPLNKLRRTRRPISGGRKKSLKTSTRAP